MDVVCADFQRLFRTAQVAKWNYLFATVGDASALYLQSLEAGKLTTAASYLIILQVCTTVCKSRVSCVYCVHGVGGDMHGTSMRNLCLQCVGSFG